jgi:hypothetical protein
MLCFDCVPLDPRHPPKVYVYVDANSWDRLYDYHYLPGSFTYYDYALKGAGLYGRAGKDWDVHNDDGKSSEDGTIAVCKGVDKDQTTAGAG